MKRTTSLGSPLFYKVGQVYENDSMPYDADGIPTSGGASTTSNVLPPVTADADYDVILTPTIIKYEQQPTNNTDASVQPTGTPSANDLTNDSPLPPVTTTPTTETKPSVKINKNWWWVLAAGALAYKLSKK